MVRISHGMSFISRQRTALQRVQAISGARTWVVEHKRPLHRSAPFEQRRRDEMRDWRRHKRVYRRIVVDDHDGRSQSLPREKCPSISHLGRARSALSQPSKSTAAILVAQKLKKCVPPGAGGGGLMCHGSRNSLNSKSDRYHGLVGVAYRCKAPFTALEV